MYYYPIDVKLYIDIKFYIVCIIIYLDYMSVIILSNFIIHGEIKYREWSLIF